MAVISVLSVLACGVAAAPAQAVDRVARASLPVRAGTHLIFGDRQVPARSPDYDCPAGAVLTGSGILLANHPHINVLSDMPLPRSIAVAVVRMCASVTCKSAR